LLQAENLSKETFDSADNIDVVVDKLITLLIRIHEEKGYNVMETKLFMIQCISLSYQTPKNIFDWLVKHQTTVQYVFFLGFLYYNGIIVEKNGDEAFKSFTKASENHYPMAQVNVIKWELEPKSTMI